MIQILFEISDWERISKRKLQMIFSISDYCCCSDDFVLYLGENIYLKGKWILKNPNKI